MLNGVPVSAAGVIVLLSGLVTAPVAIMCSVKTESPAVFESRRRTMGHAKSSR